MKFVLLAFVIVANGLLTGCTSPVYKTGISVQSPSNSIEPYQPGGISMTVPTRYRIQVGDQLEVRFHQRPGYSDSYLVRPDGRITLPVIGSVKVASTTPDELTAQLRKRYQKTLTESPPAVEKSYILLPGDVLEIRFSYFTEGNSIVEVRSDGRISLPIIGDVLAEGKTPSRMQSELKLLFSPHIPNPDLVVIVKEAKSNIFFYRGEPRTVPDLGLIDLAINVTRTVPQVVYVGGEVPSPGIQTFQANSSLMQVILSAGGPTTTADMRSAVILRRAPDNSVIRIGDVG